MSETAGLGGGGGGGVKAAAIRAPTTTGPKENTQRAEQDNTVVTGGTVAGGGNAETGNGVKTDALSQTPTTQATNKLNGLLNAAINGTPSEEDMATIKDTATQLMDSLPESPEIEIDKQAFTTAIGKLSGENKQEGAKELQALVSDLMKSLDEETRDAVNSSAKEALTGPNKNKELLGNLKTLLGAEITDQEIKDITEADNSIDKLFETLLSKTNVEFKEDSSLVNKESLIVAAIFLALSFIVAAGSPVAAIALLAIGASTAAIGTAAQVGSNQGAAPR